MLAIQRGLKPVFFILLSLPATAMGFALAVQISALSWILTTQYGLDIHDVGLVWAAGPIAGIIGQILIGVISDKTWLWGGRRKPFIFVGGLCAALMLLALPSIDIISSSLGIEAILGIAIAVALGLDLSINISFNPTRAVIADVTPKGIERTKGYTWMQTVSGLFGVLAYAVGAWLGNYILIYFAVGLVLFFSIVPAFFIEEPRQLLDDDSLTQDNKTRFDLWGVLLAIQPLWALIIYCLYALVLRVSGVSSSHYYAQLLCLLATLPLMLNSLLKRKSNSVDIFRKICAAHALSWIAVQTMFVYMIAYVQDKMPNLNALETGKVLSISFLFLNAVAALLPAALLEPLAGRFGRIRTHTVCVGIMAGAYALLAVWGDSPMSLYVLMAICGIGWGSMVSLPFAIISQQVQNSQMGLYMGLFNLSVVVPQLFASLGVGLVISEIIDKAVIFQICAVAMGFSMLAWCLIAKDEA